MTRVRSSEATVGEYWLLQAVLWLTHIHTHSIIIQSSGMIVQKQSLKISICAFEHWVFQRLLQRCCHRNGAQAKDSLGDACGGVKRESDHMDRRAQDECCTPGCSLFPWVQVFKTSLWPEDTVQRTAQQRSDCGRMRSRSACVHSETLALKTNQPANKKLNSCNKKLNSCDQGHKVSFSCGSPGWDLRRYHGEG